MKVPRILALFATVGVFSMSHAYAQEAATETSRMAHQMKADTDHDGKISHEEFTAASQQRSEKHFKRMDANADGFIDKAERQAAFAKMCARKHQHHAQDKAEAKPS